MEILLIILLIFIILNGIIAICVCIASSKLSKIDDTYINDYNNSKRGIDDDDKIGSYRS